MAQPTTQALCLSFLGALVITFASSAAHADMETLRNENDELWGAVGVGFFNYKEPDTAPDLPDSEHGYLPNVAAGVTWMMPDTSNSWARNLFLSFEASGEFGGADYNGALFVDPTIAVKGTTQETIANVDAQIGRGLPLGSNVMFIPYFQFGYHFWDRDLGAGQVEDYNHEEALGGLKIEISPMSRLVLSAYGAAGTTISPEMKTFGTTFDLGSSGVYKVGGKIGYDLTHQMQLFTTLDFDHFRYVQSPVIEGAFEPDSFTSNTVWRVGLGWHFR